VPAVSALPRALLLLVALAQLATASLPCSMAATLAAGTPASSDADDGGPILKVFCPCGCGPGPASGAAGGSWLGPPARGPEPGLATRPGQLAQASLTPRTRPLPALDHVPLPV